jgi:hypothetical protein
MRIHWGEMGGARPVQIPSDPRLSARGTRPVATAPNNNPSGRPGSKFTSTKSVVDRLAVLKAQFGSRPDIARLDDDTPFDVLLLLRSEVHGWVARIKSLGRGAKPIRTLGDFRRLTDAALRSRPRIGARMFSELSKLRCEVAPATTKADGGRRTARNIKRALEQRLAFLEKTYGRHPQIVYLKDDTPIDVLLLHKSSVHGWSAGIHSLGRGPEALSTLGDLRHISDAVLRIRPRIGPRVFAELRVACPYQSKSALKTPPANKAGRAKVDQRRVNPAI